MRVLNDNVIVLKVKNEYQGILQGIDSNDSTKGKVMGIGPDVTGVSLGEFIMIDWNKAKNIKNDLFVVKQEDIVAVYEEEDLV